MNPTDPAFPTAKDLSSSSGMDLRTYMATHLAAAFIAADKNIIENLARGEDEAQMVVDGIAAFGAAQADALIARLNAKP